MGQGMGLPPVLGTGRMGVSQASWLALVSSQHSGSTSQQSMLRLTLQVGRVMQYHWKLVMHQG